MSQASSGGGHKYQSQWRDDLVPIVEEEAEATMMQIPTSQSYQMDSQEQLEQNVTVTSDSFHNLILTDLG